MRMVALSVLALVVAVSACKKEGGDAGAEKAKKEGAAAAADYASKAKTTEAIDNIDKIYKGAASYFTIPKVDMTGTKLPCQFPESVEWSPGGNPCDNSDKKFAADVNTWSGPTWSALSFQIVEPHYFRYKVESSGTMADAKMTITASADLDCDGKWSSFTRVIKGDPNSTNAECSVAPSGAFEVKDELE